MSNSGTESSTLLITEFARARVGELAHFVARATEEAESLKGEVPPDLRAIVDRVLDQATALGATVAELRRALNK